MKPYVYILIRKDLTNSQRVVQSSHVAWELSRLHKLEVHPSMVLIGVNDLQSLEKQVCFLEDKNLKVIKFYEPLFQNQLTAIGVLTTSEADRKNFKKYQLLSDISFYPEQLQQEIKLKNCTHKNLRPDYVETFKYEYTPCRICTVCSKRVDLNLSEEEKINLYQKWHEDIFDGQKPSSEQIKLKKDGFNL